MRPWPLVLAAAIALGFTLAAPDELHHIGQTAQRLADDVSDAAARLVGDAADTAAQLAGDIIPAGCSPTVAPDDSEPPAYDGLSDEASAPAEQSAPGEEAAPSADSSNSPVDEAPTSAGMQTESGEEGAAATASRPNAELTSAQSEALDLLTQAAGDFSGKVDGLTDKDLTVGDVLAAYDLLLQDAELDYVSGIEYYYLDNADDDDACTLTGFELYYLIDDDLQASYAQSVDAAVDEVVAQVRASNAVSDEEVALAAAQALQARCLGVSGSTSTLFCAYGCLVEGNAVGKGFADAYKLVLDQLGIDCLVLCDTGAPEGEGTYWNLVKVDGAWYHVDLYWDSRTKENEQATLLYFLCNDDAMRAGGVSSWDAPAQVPQGYYDKIAGSDDASRLALAQDLWKKLLDQGAPSLDGIERYRLTYREVSQAFDMLDPAWYGYVASMGATFLSNTASNDEDCVVCSLTAEYRLSPSEIAQNKQLLTDGAAWACDWVDPQTDTATQVLAVHDWLVRHVAYDQDDSRASHTAYGLFANATAVCEGYSQAFMLAMERLGVPCVIVRSEDMAHQWNMVCIDGTWYHVDVTWDDPTPDQGTHGEVSQNHFLRSDDSMRELGYYGWSAEHEAPSDYTL